MAQNIVNMTPVELDRPNVSASSFAVAETSRDVSSTYNERSITYNGSLVNYDYESLLKQKQTNIYKFFELFDYFVDSDDLVGGAIHHLYLPFSVLDRWYLTGGTKQTQDKYMEWFERISLDDKLRSWFYQLYVFANVYFSLMEDGDLVTLPPHLMRITNVTVGGNPLAEFNVKSLKQDLRTSAQKSWKKFLDDEKMDIRIAGYPKEVTEALKKNVEWVQLDPKTTWVLQGDKPEWSRYAIPMISMALIPLAHKALIRKEEEALLNLAASSFVHGSVGSPKDSQVVVDQPILSSILSITKNGMLPNNRLVITNDCVNYKVVQPDMNHFYDDNRYRDANESILGALGINSSVASGNDSSVSFGTSQISTKLVSMRISAARRSMEKLINKIMRAVNGAPYGLPRSNDSKIPTFHFPECDLTQVEAFQNECMKLYEHGVLSIKTLLSNYNINMETEYERKKEEMSSGATEVFVKPGTNAQKEEKEEKDGGEGNPVGRPTEEGSDESKAITGRAPKPSRPEGSEPQEE